MEFYEIQKNITSAKNRDTIFDALCHLQSYIDNHKDDIFFEEITAKDGKLYKKPKNEFTVDCIGLAINTTAFYEHFLLVARHKRDNGELKMTSGTILESANFINLSLNSSFYLIANLSAKLSQNNIEYLGKVFFSNIKIIQEHLSYEFDIVEIISVLETVIFDHEFAYTKKYSSKFDDKNFYSTLKKSRLIIGNYLLDFSIPIIISNAFHRIVKLRAIFKEGFDITKSVNILASTLNKYEFLKNGFQIKSVLKGNQGYDGELGSFAYYFNTRESNKILFLVKNVIDGLEYDEKDIESQKTFTDKALIKVSRSGEYLEKIKSFFVKNFSVFAKKAPSNNPGQWSNKSFLNTIKFFSLLEAISKSDDNEWKKKTFLKYFHDWITDVNDNVNFFSNVDDFNEIKNLLSGGENDKVEFKSTFGFPIEGYETESQLKQIKRDVCDKISDTIIAMANSFGGNIFIGVVEKSDKIKDTQISSHLVRKEGICFLDIRFSLRQENEDLDSKRLTIQQLLSRRTGERMDFLDSLFVFRFYQIYIEEKQDYIRILNIYVKKSPKIIFLKKDDIWITMPKRLNGRVEKINPSEEIRKILE